MATWIWREALDLLSSVMPGSTGFVLDQIEGIPHDAWQRFRIDDDDITLGHRLVGQTGTILGNELIVVTDASWRSDVGPFFLPTWHLSGLIRDHAVLAKEPFFNGDLVILSPDEGAVVALHRAGLMAIAQGVPSPRPPLLPLAHLNDSSVFAGWPEELEWRHQYGEIYPETAITLPSGRAVRVRWFEVDARVSFTDPKGDFQIFYRGDAEELDDVYDEFVAMAGISSRDVMRLPAQP